MFSLLWVLMYILSCFMFFCFKVVDGIYIFTDAMSMLDNIPGSCYQARETVQKLRALVALPDILSLLLGTQMVAHSHL